ncbi:ABC transporter ATP-binding protein [Blastococcus sp. CT_GayMR16]|uniref:ABC transporter ATP-binding protein n=1 Tax=Blastococcus sp. CT_GayMR16 TaxID=2559607 RepID=UPI001073197E|nr:ABC transporter ATP-binding protein [Blastococcus sp. CT_GayMR16]TFV91086.1 ABC transporter ATP-binding protein [Blastococcus sp. CT_GayMR16]
MTGVETLVDCRGLTRLFGKGEAEVAAVRDVNGQVRHGQRIAVTGESGSGKSTLLHLMAGLDTPTSGTVTWPGLTMRAGRPLGIGVVFQAPSLLPALDVTDNVALPLLLADVPRSEARLRAEQALDRLGLTGLASSTPEELSGGQAQRVAIARVLAAEPALVIADEPTGQLDRRTATHVLDVLLATVGSLGAALVVSTHDPEVADRLDVRWAMADGRRREPAPQVGAR